MLAVTQTIHQPALNPELEAPLSEQSFKVEPTEEQLELAQHRADLKGYLGNLLDHIRAEKIALTTKRTEQKSFDAAAHKELSTLIEAHAADIAELREAILRNSRLTGGFTVAHEVEVDGVLHQVLSAVPYCQYDVGTDSLMSQTVGNREVIHFQLDQIVI